MRKLLRHVRLFATPWTIQSVGFSRPEYWSGWLFRSPGDLPNPGIEPMSSALQADSLPAEPKGKPYGVVQNSNILHLCVFPTDSSRVVLKFW